MRRRSSFLRALLCGALVTASGAAVLAGATPAGAFATHDDTIYAFGSATFRGSTESLSLQQPVVAMATSASGAGYWLVGRDGAVYSYGAPFYGSLYGAWFKPPVVGMAATPTGRGYWIVTADGAVFPFGDAKGYGGLTSISLNAPITAIIPGPGGLGYWLYASDGGVFSFGSAHFHGSTGSLRLNAPVVGMASTPSGNGYWLVASDGGIFSFGDAHFRGSTGSLHLNAPIVGMARDGTGQGYWLAGADGGVFTFGDAHFRGSASGLLAPGRHVVQLVGMPDGNGYRMLTAHDVPDVALVAPGAQGPGVVDLQQRLAAMGYWLPSINGVFDADTEQAVWAFQKANGLARTGIIDFATQAKFRTATRPIPRSRVGPLIEIDKTRQILMVVDNGFAQWTFNTSTGSDHPYWLNGVLYSAHTPEGVFTIIRQVDGPDHGPLGTLWRPKYFTWSGIAIHGYPEVPPYPASHGCTRVSNNAVNWMWANNILPLGKTVWVYV
ncbi:MAG TPA: L,D-transpeptidase family protein [Acidimicrobiia bacterium]|nr:L,D-transpeptidase family protein [Acidimicrobiia bacterium]